MARAATQYFAQISLGKGDATLSTDSAWVYDMEENSTAATLNARELVMIGCDNEIIGLILPPQILMRCKKRQGYVAIIEAVTHGITPAIHSL